MPKKQPTVQPVAASRPGLIEHIARIAIVPWLAVLGWVALDSALTYRKSQQAIDDAIAADPIAELYDGPTQQSGRMQRWLLWSPGTLGRLRAVRGRAKALMIGAPLVAIAGAPVLFGLAVRKKRPG